MRGKRSFLCGRNTRTHIQSYDFRRRGRSRPYPGRPQAEHRRVPGTSSECIALSSHRCSKGDFETGVTDRKKLILSRSKGAESRGGAARRGAPRSARKNIIYVRRNGRPIAALRRDPSSDPSSPRFKHVDGAPNLARRSDI